MTENTEQEQHGHDERETLNSNYYGVLPGVAGVLIGLALIAVMFALADGFA